MEYKDIWNDLCFRIKDKNQNAPERDFQIIAESLFEKLGWLQYKGEIISQKSIPVGASGNVRPDIVIAENGKNIFVIELKRPGILVSERNSEQLFGYMRLLKLSFGILLGESLQVYFEVPDDEKPRKIGEIKFDLESEDGINFIKLISKSEYSHEKIANYCKVKIAMENESKRAQDYIDKLCSVDGVKIVTDLLKEKLLAEFSEGIITSMIGEIDIHISRKQGGPIQEAPEPPLSIEEGGKIELLPNYKVFRNNLLKTHSANWKIIYVNGKEEKGVWSAENFTETSDLYNNIRSGPLRGWIKKGIMKIILEVRDV